METLRYHRVAIYLHWLIAVLIIGNLSLGFFMGSDWTKAFETSTRFGMYQWHKTFGILVLFLSVLRVYWRLTHRPPPLPDSMPKLEKTAAHLGHLGLYALMLLIPFSGWLLVSASTLNIPTLLFGVWRLPHLPIKQFLSDAGAFAKDMAELHELLAYAMIALLIVHILAALRHHFWLKDGILQRMSLKS